MAAPNADHGTGRDDDVPERPDDPTGPRPPRDDDTSDPTPSSGPPDDDPALDVDRQWAGIVAELSDLSGLDGPARSPEGEGRGPTAPGTRAPGDPLGSIPRAPWVRASGPRDSPTTPEIEDLEEAESHFVPPDPPLVLGRDPLLTMAWTVVAGVPLVLLVLLVVARPFPVIAAQVGIGLFLAGLAVLLWRMPHHRDDDRGPGAVV
ncbi:hypothetical protein [Cellulosimicrobium arenosum]|uniref:DUF308 domain-containing protein n=1 Tax=Cellulosimicrobium arenosum TaxID=2708133 RepID=A0A927IYP3_9MICO|nr:hypothetical protein [Cellulosimicrobium arenosum]MBD8077574.1 hypothetical protein [Cellulosimicrobium arenosum]